MNSDANVQKLFEALQSHGQKIREGLANSPVPKDTVEEIVQRSLREHGEKMRVCLERGESVESILEKFKQAKTDITVQEIPIGDALKCDPEAN